MKLLDSTLNLSDYLQEHNNMIHKGGLQGMGGWCQNMTLSDGTMDTLKGFLWLKDVLVPHVIAEFEIHNNTKVAIPKSVWPIIYPKVKEFVAAFEKESGQSMTIMKVDGPTQWSDY